MCVFLLFLQDKNQSIPNLVHKKLIVDCKE